MSRAICWIATALLVLAAPASAAQQRKNAEPPPPPFHVDVATRTMSLQRAVSQVTSSTVIGKAGAGLLCNMRSELIYSSHVFGPSTPQELAMVFAEEAAAAGYRIPASQANMFETGEAARPELAVGVALLDIKESGCVINVVVERHATMEASLKVEWQVFDPLEKRLLFRGTSDGTAKVSLASDGTLGRMAADAALAAFRQASKVVLADPAFLAAVRDPKGGAPADANALFPEAAAAPAPKLEIVRLQLATADFKDQVARLREQVVTVITGNGSGSAFYISDNLLLTNHHVIAGFQHVRIRFLGGREITGEVVTSNAKRDVALIKTDSAGVAGLPLRLDNPDLTSRVFVIGSPLGQKNEGSISAGIVSAYREEKQGPFLQSDVAVTHGNSGGPMFDEKGNVVAMTDLGEAGTAVNRFIPIADAIRVLEIQFRP